MQKLLVAIAVCGLFCALPLFAADTPKAEVFGGYQLLHQEGLSMSGFNGAVEGNINKSFGIVGDFGMGIKSTPDIKVYSYMAGPRFSYRAEKVRLFAQALVGGVSVNEGTTENDFGMMFGGGIDLPLNKNISLRPAEFDWLTARSSGGTVVDWSNHLRFSAGIVFKLGAKK
jgi:hypothetical protein